MKKQIALSLVMLGMTVFSFAEEKKPIENAEAPKIETEVSSMKTKQVEIPSDITKSSKPAHQKQAELIESCYGGMTSCGVGYMFCQDQPLTGADQLIIWDFFDGMYCG